MYPLQVILELAAAAGVTSTEDAAKHPEIGSLAEGRDELIGLTLWLLAEQHQVCPCPCSASNRRSVAVCVGGWVGGGG